MQELINRLASRTLPLVNVLGLLDFSNNIKTVLAGLTINLTGIIDRMYQKSTQIGKKS